jgi:hypothetical protein
MVLNDQHQPYAGEETKRLNPATLISIDGFNGVFHNPIPFACEVDQPKIWIPIAAPTFFPIPITEDF